jgi:hypothetical protein
LKIANTFRINILMITTILFPVSHCSLPLRPI